MKVLEELAEVLLSIQTELGNLSSASVLMVLRDTLADNRPAPGTWGQIGRASCRERVFITV